MTGARRDPAARLELWGWASIGVNVLLFGLNLAVLWLSGSLAVAAEMVHNLVDLMASTAVLVGLKLARRKSEQFPYGMYKVENVVAAGVALLIFLAAYEIAREALLGKNELPEVTSLVLGGVVLSALIPLVFSAFQLRAGKKANSPSLIADAREYRVHVLTSGLVLIALLGHRLDLNLERIAALLVVVAVVKTGWDLLADSMRVLMDASLDAETLSKAREIIETEPSLFCIRSLVGRNAGRYRFLEAVVEVRLHDLDRAARVARELTGKLHAAVPFLERALVDVRPARRESLRFALPLESDEESPHEQFGAAPLFLIADFRLHDGELIDRKSAVNPFSGDSRGRGIRVAQWLAEQKVDVLATPDDMRDKGPGHTLREAGIEIAVVPSSTIDEALDAALAATDCPGGGPARA
jgi:cation diffusion facilitator family transporter